MAIQRPAIAALLITLCALITGCHPSQDQKRTSGLTSPANHLSTEAAASNLPAPSATPTSAAPSVEAPSQAFALKTGLKLLAVSTPLQLQTAYPSTQCTPDGNLIYCEIKPADIIACGEETECNSISYIFDSSRLTDFLAEYSENDWNTIRADMIRHYGQPNTIKNINPKLPMRSTSTYWSMPNGKFTMTYFYGSDVYGNPINNTHSATLEIKNTYITNDDDASAPLLDWKSDKYLECEQKIVSMVDMRNCMGDELSRRKSQLQHALSKRANTQDASERTSMFFREKTWEKFRDDECNSGYDPNPTAGNMDSATLCEIQLTIEGANDLNRDYR